MKNKDDSMDWIPLWVDKWIFGSTRIELQPDERSVWVDLMALAGKDNGFIRANPQTPYPPPQLAGLLCITEELLQRTIQRCIETGKIKECDNSSGYYILNWAEYQLSDRHKRRFTSNIGRMSEEAAIMSPEAVPIGEERIGYKEEERRGEGVKETEKTVTQQTPEKLTELFNAVTQYLPKVTEIGRGRKDKIKTRVKEGKNSLDWWKTVFEKADQILLPGKDGRKDWFPNFDWLVDNDRNAVKVFEGNYDDARRPSGHPNGKSRKSDTPPLDPDERRLWEAEKRLRPDPDETAPESP